MDIRYINPKIAEIFGNRAKLERWQEVEIAVIRARLKLNECGLSEALVNEIVEALYSHPINEKEWLERDAKINHDLNAFLEERVQYLSLIAAKWLHKDMTSFDTEEPAFARALILALEVLEPLLAELKQNLKHLAERYRFTPMPGVTHGQHAELQTFGRRVISWLAEVNIAERHIADATWVLRYSKLSGAIGNYGGVDPELEKVALADLGFEPFYGATQIMPRSLYTNLASGLVTLVKVLEKIAHDIRLNARSPRPLMQEPFGKNQKGSSVMPHKKNPINLEKMTGIARLAVSCLVVIFENVFTWEERSIEQSSAERVAWSDLFHATAHVLKTLNKVLSGLRVYPENMFQQIADSRGCIASGDAKEVLKNNAARFGLDVEDCYRIVQLAAFNVFNPSVEDQELRDSPPKSLEQASVALKNWQSRAGQAAEIKVSIKEIIAEGLLRVSSELEADLATVERWNISLQEMFSDDQVRAEWDKVFSPEYLLRNEGYVFEKVIGG